MLQKVLRGQRRIISTIKASCLRQVVKVEKGDNMTWSFTVNGHDSFPDEDGKIAFEKKLVEDVKSLVDELKETAGCEVTSGEVVTNTTGAVVLA